MPRHLLIGVLIGLVASSGCGGPRLVIRNERGEVAQGDRSMPLIPIEYDREDVREAVEPYAGEKRPILINGRRRIPDGINRQTKVATEVKNVRQLSFTRQIHDLVDYAKQEGLRFDLWVPKGEVELSGPLKDAISQGQINLRRIP